ncbi:NTP pyrophosphohydrolase [Streptomyces antioxidans]|uniref:NTP pyrophosphohydrolase n=1 Tax=Streptomyces antioxidans TaxID=1507734 RepID=A0A1V4D1I5_9ACTN|nr:NTP pyrophosphohydrolase [Streptomyces antioxidans]OPF76556.1 NTP pyrophosphohydrolase [Streptomyces antioxidans]
MDGVVVVDAANVVGSVPDGWWRDRRGAAERLRDRLAVLAGAGLPGRPGVPGWATEPPVDIVMVVEGAARGVEPVAGVRVESAPGSGDDHIVAVVAAREQGRPCLVVTADQGLRARVAALGAETVGPRSVRPNGSAP